MGQEKGQRTEGKQPHFTQTPPLLFWAPPPPLHTPSFSTRAAQQPTGGGRRWGFLLAAVDSFCGRRSLSNLTIGTDPSKRNHHDRRPAPGEPPRRCCLPDSEYGLDSMAPYLRLFFCASQPRLPASRLLLLLAPSSFRLGAIVTSQRRQRRDEARRVVAVAETRTWRVLDNRHGMSTADTAQPATREVPLKREGDTSSGTFMLIGLQPLQHPKIQPGVGWVPYC